MAQLRALHYCNSPDSRGKADWAIVLPLCAHALPVLTSLQSWLCSTYITLLQGKKCLSPTLPCEECTTLVIASESWASFHPEGNRWWEKKGWEGQSQRTGPNLKPKCLYQFLIHRFKLGLHFFYSWPQEGKNCIWKKYWDFRKWKDEVTFLHVRSNTQSFYTDRNWIVGLFGIDYFLQNFFEPTPWTTSVTLLLPPCSHTNPMLLGSQENTNSVKNICMDY